MDSVNSYAIVAYVAGPVAQFANRLRQELVPGCPHSAHLTILPPRPLYCPAAEAIESARQLVARFEPFEVRLNGIEQFPKTQVIHIAVTSGACELTALHDVLNAGCFAQQEVFEYVPHVTVGQELPSDSFERCLELARRRWQEFGPPPPLRIERLTLVQQREDGSWENVAELGLGRVPAAG